MNHALKSVVSHEIVTNQNQMILLPCPVPRNSPEPTEVEISPKRLY